MVFKSILNNGISLFYTIIVIIFLCHDILL